MVGTGKTDYASDGERVFSIANGHPMMTRVTGMGCVATSIVAAFLAVQPIPLVAAVHAMAFVGLAGEWAAERARNEGAGTFRVKFLDSFERLELGDFESAHVRELRARVRFLSELGLSRATLIPSVVGKTQSLRTLANRGDRSVERWPDYCFPLAASSHRSESQGMESGFAAIDDGKDSPTSPPTPPGLKARPY